MGSFIWFWSSYGAWFDPTLSLFFSVCLPFPLSGFQKEWTGLTPFYCFRLSDWISRSPAMQRGGRWKSLKERLGMGSCCGSLWGFGGEMRMPVREDSSEGEREEEEEDDETTGEIRNGGAQNAGTEEDCLQTRGTGMNLAMALAAERHFRAAAAQQRQEEEEACVTSLRVSLMRLLEEGEDAAAAEEKEQGGEREKSNLLCCVCMGRRKGSAFIPCGHTFCRVCSRELWLNRGSCPLCNRSIIDVLDIF